MDLLRIEFDELNEDKKVQKTSAKKKPVESAGKEEQHEEGKAS